MTRPARNTATRDRHRRYIRRTKPPCALCKQPIDYTLHYRDPMAYVVDHIIPIARGGEDGLSNIQAAHRRPVCAMSPRAPSSTVNSENHHHCART